MQVNVLNNYYAKNNIKPELGQEKVVNHTFSDVLQDSLQSNSAKQVRDSFAYSSKTTEVGEFKGTYPERLEQIHRLNEQTDWNALSDVEKVKLFESRYDRAFGDMDVIRSNLYYCYSTRHEEINDDYYEEMDKYFGDNGKGGLVELKKPFSQCRREANYGALSDSEIRASIQKKYAHSNSMESKCLMFTEFLENGVIKPAEGELWSCIELQIFSRVEDANKFMLYGTGMKISDHPRFLDMFMSCAKGIGDSKNYTPNWTQVIDIAKGMFHPAKDADGNAYLNEIRKGMDDFLDEILKRDL